MLQVVRQFFSSNGFMPHGHCYLWNPNLVWLQVISNALIGLSYVAISFTLAYLVYRIREMPFQWMYIAFGVFIITCGFTHLLDVVTIWNPIYWTDGGVRVVTAIASLGTAVLLPPLIPKAIALARGIKLALDRGIKLETINKELSALFEKTRELDELKTQFFANVSHELRTPLTLILGPIERIRIDQNLTDVQRRDLEVVLRNARILLKHVNDLLDIAKLEAGKMLPHYRDTDLAQVVRLIASNFDGAARDKNISFSVNVPRAMKAQIDPDMVQRIIINLLSNAFKFAPVGGRVSVTLEKRNENVQLQVQDNGPGIPAEMRNAIFERFRQLEGGVTRRFGGTGLGLSIAKEFTQLHRGRIHVSDSPGGGALFSVELPLRAPAGVPVLVPPISERDSENLACPAEESLREVSRELGEAPATQASKKGTVLVVEDNVDMNRFIAETLSSEYTVITAFDGKQGLEKAVSEHLDLILSDIMMPVMSGDQMVAEIRKRQELRGLPIMLLTAKADDDLRVKLLHEGAQDYVIKPFSPEEVLVRVKNLVTVKRAREALQTELSSQVKDIEALASEVTARRKELQETAKRLEVAKNEAERLSQVKSTFLGLVSHEMKTPLTSLQLQLEMLRRIDAERLTPRQVEMIERLSKSSQRSIRLMNSLFDFIKFQSGRIEPNVESFDLPAVASECIDSFQNEAREKKLELKIMPPPRDFPKFRGDRFLVQIVVTNLITNAIKFTDQGSINVSLLFKDDQYFITVRDTGQGIPKELQARIFEPFEQVTSLARKNKPGFGLGLAIAKEAVRILGGKIELISESGKGSTFTVMLPAIDDEKTVGEVKKETA